MSTFSFERMLVSFENLPFSYDGESALPDAEPFILAMREVGRLFDHLGPGFGFVKRDVEQKVEVVAVFTNKDREANKSLQDSVTREIKANGHRIKSPPSVSRTILRLMWATRFIYELMKNVGTTYKPGKAENLQKCVSEAYDSALRENHPWLIRQAAYAAVKLLPDITRFLTKLGVDRTRREEYLQRADEAMGPLISKMYSFYRVNNLMDLP